MAFNYFYLLPQSIQGKKPVHLSSIIYSEYYYTIKIWLIKHCAISRQYEQYH